MATSADPAARWNALLVEPPQVNEPGGWGGWFLDIAGRLLGGCRLVVAGVPHRLTEVEFYYHGGTHRDPFAHREPVQRHLGRWYFHRSHGVLRGGSFKGLDLTFAGPEAFGGILLRGIEQEGGALIDGPSRSVDHLLHLTGQPTVAALDAALDGQTAWDAEMPLYLRWLDDPPPAPPPLATARVGLSLRRFRDSEEAVRFLGQRYRFLSEPRRIRKGKLQTVVALHLDGLDPTAIAARTGTPRAALLRYLADFEAGRRETDAGAYFGIDLGPRDLARLLGCWQARYGS